MRYPVVLTLGFLGVVGLVAAAAPPLSAQYVPPNPGTCGRGFFYSANMCVPRSGGGLSYKPSSPGMCAKGFLYSVLMCVPRQGSAINAYRPEMVGACARGYQYSAGMCVPRP